MGKLTVVVVNGTDLSGDRIGKCDGYVVLAVGSQRSQTNVKRNNKNPVWNETFVFEASPADSVLIEVWDKDVLTKDDLLGREIITVASLGGTDGTVQRSVNLSKQGRVNLALKFEGGPTTPSRSDATTVVAPRPVPDLGSATAIAPSPARLVDTPLPATVTTTSNLVETRVNDSSTITTLLSRMELPPLRGGSTFSGTVPLSLLRGPEQSPSHPTNVRVEVWWIHAQSNATLWVQGDQAPLDSPKALAAPEEHAAPWVGNFELPSETLVRWQVGVRDEKGNYEWAKPRVHLTSTTNSQTSHVLWGKGQRTL